jgi:peptidoglycan/xylan/chitin deacetylase (PgdA/CDA1 family)
MEREQDQPRELSRRGLLVSLGISAGAVWLGAAGDAPDTAPHRAVATVIHRPPPPPPPAPAPVPSTAPAVPAMQPIHTLADYRKAVPGPPFPANAVALTIDDGPHPVWTPKVLDLLERYHVPATFCLIGNQVRGHEDVARSVVAAGHHVANHSYNHLINLPTVTPERMRDEIDRAQDKIYSTTAYTPHLFRPPGGGTSSQLLDQVAGAGLIPFDWSEDPRDWTRPGTAAITQRMLSARPGQILLCHDGGGDRSETYAALQAVIPALQARGYTFVSL